MGGFNGSNYLELKESYARVDNKDLLDLYFSHNLTDIVKPVLENLLLERGVSRAKNVVVRASVLLSIDLRANANIFYLVNTKLEFTVDGLRFFIYGSSCHYAKSQVKLLLRQVCSWHVGLR
jgi:hypothetical protein